jgi:hypothetical protein
MFEALNSIDWESLSGCYNSAEEMPHFLRSFLSPVPEIRDWAIDEISSAVIHQGSVYDVSPVAVPFLFELLENEEVEDKEQIVHLLTSMASCGVYEESNEEYRSRIDAELRQEQGITYEESLQSERELVRLVKSEIAKRFDLLYPYLRYRGEFHVRLSVATALNEFPEIANRLRPDLELALQSEKDEHVRNAIAMAMADK